MEIRQPEAEPINLEGGSLNPWIVLVALAAFAGHMRLLWSAQGWFFAYVAIPPLWIAVYFTLFNPLGRSLSVDWDPALPRNRDVGNVAAASLVIALAIVQAIVWGSLSLPVTTQGSQG